MFDEGYVNLPSHPIGLLIFLVEAQLERIFANWSIGPIIYNFSFLPIVFISQFVEYFLILQIFGTKVMNNIRIVHAQKIL